jgi:hypothetical protein
MAGSDENRGRSRKLGVEDRGWSSTAWVLGGRMIKRSGDDVCSLHRTQGDEEHEFLGLASKLRSMVLPSLASKLVATVCGFASKSLAQISRFLGLKTGSCGLVIWPTKSPRRFLGLGLKTK